MRLKEILEILYDEIEFKLYDENAGRIGIFNNKDSGIKEFENRTIAYIEPDSKDTIAITLEED